MTAAIRILPVIRRTVFNRSMPSTTAGRRAFSANTSLLAKRYSKDHEWIELDDSGKIGTIGITEYAAKALGDVTYVELPEVDLEVKSGDALGAVESVKSASDIYAPVSGKVIETNEALSEKPGTISNSPEETGWLAKLEVEDASEIERLMSKSEYDAFEKDGDH